MLPAIAQTGGSEPKDAMGWFIRAHDQMNLRSDGSAPFHMKVVFHAFPGIEPVENKKPQILTGDGVYEETWISPHQWRREVTLGSYHAIEVQSNTGTRKMQFSSDYEPSRVLMLLEALLNPIARDVVSPDLREHPWRWSLDRSSAGGISFVRITASTSLSTSLSTSFIISVSNTQSATTGYVFLSNGHLVQSNNEGLLTSWQDQILFADKVVPRHLSVQAEGARNLLTADVSVETASNTDQAIFEIPGEQADGGMTLRQIHWFEVTNPACIDPEGGSINPGIASMPVPIFHAVIDRHGLTRELELIRNEDPRDIQMLHLMDRDQHLRYIPAKIHRSPTEIVLTFHIAGQ